MKWAAEAVRAFRHDDLLQRLDVMKQAHIIPLAAGEFAIKHDPTVRERPDPAALHLEQFDPEVILLTGSASAEPAFTMTPLRPRRLRMTSRGWSS